MKSYLDITCNPDDWWDIPVGERFILELKASTDPVFFWEHTKMGNFPLFDSKKEIFR